MAISKDSCNFRFCQWIFSCIFRSISYTLTCSIPSQTIHIINIHINAQPCSPEHIVNIHNVPVCLWRCVCMCTALYAFIIQPVHTRFSVYIRAVGAMVRHLIYFIHTLLSTYMCVFVSQSMLPVETFHRTTKAASTRIKETTVWCCLAWRKMYTSDV